MNRSRLGGTFGPPPATLQGSLEKSMIAACPKDSAPGIHSFAAFPLNPLAIVVELGRGPPQTVLQRVFLAPERVECLALFSRRRPVFRGGGGVLGILVVELVGHVAV